MNDRLTTIILLNFILSVSVLSEGPGTGKYNFTVNHPDIKEGDAVYDFPGYGGRKAAAGMHNGYFTDPKTASSSRDNQSKYHNLNTDPDYFFSGILEFHDGSAMTIMQVIKKIRSQAWKYERSHIDGKEVFKYFFNAAGRQQYKPGNVK